MLRYSALLVEALPVVARRVTLKQAATTPEVRTLLKDQHCRAVVAANGRELAVFGKDDEVLAALASLGAQTSGTVHLEPARDSWAVGLIYDALVRALSRMLDPSGTKVRSLPGSGDSARRKTAGKGASRTERDLAQPRVAYNSPLTGSVPKLGFPYQEGVFLKLDHIDERWWCGFEPYTFGDVPEKRPGSACCGRARRDGAASRASWG